MRPGPAAALVASALVASALVASAVTAGPAHAQSRRYPPPAVDPDDEAEHESGFWADAAEPGRARYQRALRDILLTARADPRRAVTELRALATGRPDLADAWGYLGLLSDQLRDHAACAEGYGRAVALAPRWRPDSEVAPGRGIGAILVTGRPLVVAQAMCLARAGALDRAAATLEAVVARGEVVPELWLRLGESYLAAGRLDDAGRALTDALAAAPRDGEAAWLRVLAFDRARRTDLAEAAAAIAQRVDPGAVNATASGRPTPIAAGDREYILGLAAATPPNREPPAPAALERALVYFRRYLVVAPPTSPWRARAAEHVTALASLDLARRLTTTGGELGDRAAVERAVRAHLPGLRGCLRSFPATLVDVELRVVGAAAGPAARRRPAPVEDDELGALGGGEGARTVASVIITFDRNQPGFDDALDCVRSAASAIALPRPPAGSWAVVRVPVVGP